MPQNLSLTLILAITVDGKIADAHRTGVPFPSPVDQAHLETQVSLVDGVIIGAETIRTHGSNIQVKTPQLLAQRQARNQLPQPIQIVCSRSGQLNPNLKFFEQPFTRWLITSSEGKTHWTQTETRAGFDQIFIEDEPEINWSRLMEKFQLLGLKKLGVLGGGRIVASLLKQDLIDDFWLTACPFILGGATAPTPVDGEGFTAETMKSLKLLEVNQVEQELFLHYQILH